VIGGKFLFRLPNIDIILTVIVTASFCFLSWAARWSFKPPARGGIEVNKYLNRQNMGICLFLYFANTLSPVPMHKTSCVIALVSYINLFWYLS
jgi:hypothetical protein